TNHQAYAHGCRPLDHVILHAVSVTNAMRHMKLGSSTSNLNRPLQDDDRSSAIDVVIPINKDAFGLSNRPLNALDREAHALHPVRGMQMLQFGSKKPRHGLGIANLARNQQPR